MLLLLYACICSGELAVCSKVLLFRLWSKSLLVLEQLNLQIYRCGALMVWCKYGDEVLEIMLKIHRQVLHTLWKFSTKSFVPRPLLAICLTERSQETCKMFKNALHFPNHIFWSHWVPSKCQASQLKLRSNSILCGALAHSYDEGKAKGRSKGKPSEYDDIWC